MKKMNCITVLIGLAALLLAGVKAEAQTRIRSIVLTNSNFGTAYFLQGGSNVLSGAGILSYQGGTNTTSGNSAPGMGSTNYYSGTNGTAISLTDLQNISFWWSLSVVGVTNSTYPVSALNSNSTFGLDLNPDPNAGASYWLSNVVTATLAGNGVTPSTTNILFVANNGTNVFSGYYWARWSFFSTAMTNPVSPLRNQFNFYR